MDIDLKSNSILLTAYYLKQPSELELELLDDIVTNSNAHIPDLYVKCQAKLTREYNRNEEHDFIVFAVNDEI